MLGDVDGRCAVSGADGGHHEIAAPGKPFGGVTEFHEGKKLRSVGLSETPWFMITSGKGPSPTGRTR